MVSGDLIRSERRAMSADLLPLPPELGDAFEKMLELPPAQRLLLSDMLASTVPQPLSEEWNREIDRRIDSLDRGMARTVPAEKVFERLREQLRAKP